MMAKNTQDSRAAMTSKGLPAVGTTGAASDGAPDLKTTSAVANTPLLPPGVSGGSSLSSNRSIWDYTKMILFFALAVLTAISHHFFNSSRHQKLVDNSTLLSIHRLRNQKVISFLGTAFAFIIKSFYVAAIESAYGHLVWRVWSKRRFTFGGIDNTVLLPHDIMAFRSFEVWRSATRLVTVAVLIWTISLGTVFTPGTISVVVGEVTGSYWGFVPSLDFRLVFNTQPDTVIDMVDFHDVCFSGRCELRYLGYHGPSNELRRLVAESARESPIRPGPSPCKDNDKCRYTVSFPGPAQKCDYVDIYGPEPNNPWRGNQTQNSTSGTTSNEVYEKVPLYNSFYHSFYHANATVSALKGAELWVSHKFLPRNRWPILKDHELPIARVGGLYEEWEKRTFRCLAYNATYTVNISYTHGQQMVENTTVQYLHRTNLTLPVWGGPDAIGAVQNHEKFKRFMQAHRDVYVHRAVADALIALFSGKIAIKINVGLGFAKLESDITQTAYVNRWQVERSPDILYIPVEDLRERAEALSQNITLSMLGMVDLAYRDDGTSNKTSRSQTQILIRNSANIYSYAPRNLVISYGVLTICAGLVVLAGLWARRQNGLSPDIKPSGIVAMCAELDFKDESVEEIKAKKLKLQANGTSNGQGGMVFKE